MLNFVEKGGNGPKLIQIKNKFNEIECLIIAVKLHRTITKIIIVNAKKNPNIMIFNGGGGDNYVFNGSNYSSSSGSRVLLQICWEKN